MGVLSAAFLLFLPVFASAGEWKGTCEISFLGTSTLHDFNGNVRCRQFKLTEADGPGGGALLHTSGVEVPVGEMDTGNESRDRQLRNMFRSAEYPVLRGSFKDISPEGFRQELGKSPEGKRSFDFLLKIRDIERSVHAVASGFREEGGRVSFVLDFPVSLKEYGLKPPSVLFGAIRVGDRVSVRAAVSLQAVPRN
jgi:hypothetical protein